MAGHKDHVTAVAVSYATQLINMPFMLLGGSSGGGSGSSSPASSCSVQSGGKHLVVVSGSRDRQLIVWDAPTGSEIHTLIGHRGLITCLRLSTDGTVAVSGINPNFPPI